jgi:hypothetical protein
VDGHIVAFGQDLQFSSMQINDTLLAQNSSPLGAFWKILMILPLFSL